MSVAWDQSDRNSPATPFPSLSRVKHAAKLLAQDIFADRDALFEILERYEGTLDKRWMKKTRGQRREILSAAYPDIPANHRPDFEYLRRDSSQRVRSDKGLYDSFLLPPLNLEDLLEPKSLLLFMHSRGRHIPWVFANADLNSVNFGTTFGAVVPSYLSGYIMLLLGQNTADTYGRLIAWDDDKNAKDMISKGVGVQPGQGLLILLIQQRKLRFLLDCAKSILKNLPLQNLTVPKQPVSHNFVQGREDWPSLASEVLEAPYKRPSPADISRLQGFVSARLSEAENHIWSLREDLLISKRQSLRRVNINMIKLQAQTGRHILSWDLKNFGSASLATSSNQRMLTLKIGATSRRRWTSS